MGASGVWRSLEGFAAGVTSLGKGHVDLDTLFGDRDWGDVQSSLTRRMRRRFGGRLDYDDIDDTVASAMVDLVDYWVHLPSSIVTKDYGRNFNFAVQRGTWMATTFAVQRLMTLATLVSLDEQYTYPNMVIPGPEPDDVIDDEMTTIRNFLSTLPEEEFSGWLTSFLNGETERQAAVSAGVHRSSIHERRTRGLKRLRQRAHSYGLRVA